MSNDVSTDSWLCAFLLHFHRRQLWSDVVQPHDWTSFPLILSIRSMYLYSIFSLSISITVVRQARVSRHRPKRRYLAHKPSWIRMHSISSISSTCWMLAWIITRTPARWTHTTHRWWIIRCPARWWTALAAYRCNRWVNCRRQSPLLNCIRIVWWNWQTNYIFYFRIRWWTSNRDKDTIRLIHRRIYCSNNTILMFRWVTGNIHLFNNKMYFSRNKCEFPRNRKQQQQK